MINTMEIRKLHEEDVTLYEKMDTGLENDYVLRVFQHLTEGNNNLFGLFIDGEIAVVGGFTIYQKRYAMLGRLRTDQKFRGKNLATELNQYLMKEAFHTEGIEWVGANTQEDNHPAKRVLEKLGFPALISLHGAVAESVEALTTNEDTWREILNVENKREWVQKALIDEEYIFPYQCYYPFPASWDLFGDEELNTWRFFENKNKTRFFILKTDQKKHHYLHLVYPWSDLQKQTGIWETVQSVYDDIVDPESEEETYIWVDLTKEEASRLPAGHPFKLPSPWVLHGITKKEWERMD